MLAKVVLVIAAVFAAYSFVSSISTKRRHAAMAKARGCEPAPTEPRTDPFALINLGKTIWAHRNNEVLSYLRSTFDKTSSYVNRTVYTYQTDFLGDRVLFTCDPKNIQAILATQFKDYELGQIRIGSFKPLLGHGIFSADGKQWEHARALLRPQFSRDQVSDLELEERHVQNMLQALPAKAGAWSDEVDLQPLFFRLTMDSSSEFLYGESTNTQLSALSKEASAKNAEDTAFVEAFEACQNHISMAMLLNEFYKLMETKKFLDRCRLCHRYIDRFVNKAMSRKENRNGVEQGKKEKYVFLDSLADATDDPVEIRDQLLSILVAGRDTTAGALSFLFLMLAQHPKVFDKLRKTIIEEFGTFESPNDISFSRLKACSYLQWCLSETLRLHPSLPWNGRRSARDTTLPTGGGKDGRSPIFVPKGVEIVYMVQIMQTHPEIWGQDADVFRPERWENHKHGFEFLPFNGGPRICLGQQFALTKAGYVAVRLLQRFDKLDGSPGACEPIKLSVSLTTRPKDGVKVRLHAAAE